MKDFFSTFSFIFISTMVLYLYEIFNACISRGNSANLHILSGMMIMEDVAINLNRFGVTNDNLLLNLSSFRLLVAKKTQ